MPVYDRTYRRWDGKLARHPLRFLPIISAGIRLGLRRRKTTLRNFVFFGFLLASQVPFFGLLVIHYLYYFQAENIAIPEVGQLLAQLAPYQRAVYALLLTILWPVMMLYTVLFGGELISRDREAMALPLYRSRPLTLLDYLLGKFGVIAFFLSCLTLIPCVLLWLFRVVASEERGVLVDTLPLLGAILAHTGILVTVLSLTILACSAICRRPMVARILWFGTFMVLSFFAPLMSLVLGRPEVRALSPLLACQSLAYRWYGLADFREELDFMNALKDMQLRDDVPVAAAALSLALFAGVSLLILWRSLRRVDSVGGGG